MLALFAEGIAGRVVHIKSTTEFPGETGPVIGAGDGVAARHDSRSIYLPDVIEHFADESLNAAVYRLAVLDELGFREFGTYRFDMQTARRRVPGLPTRESSALGLRESDLTLFFHCLPSPTLARILFRVVEIARIQAAVARRYPGTGRYRDALRRHLEAHWQARLSSTRGVQERSQALFQVQPAREHQRRSRNPVPPGAMSEVAMLHGALLGLDVESRLFPLAVDVLSPDADVYTSANATVACVDALGLDAVNASHGFGATDDDTMGWLQREVRLEDWDQELADLDGEIAAMEFSELNAGEEVKAGDGAGDDGELREVDIDLVAERDRLKRRIDMERSSVRRALGDDRGDVASFRYDEWDYHSGVTLRAWCRLYEERLHAPGASGTAKLLDAVRPHARAARRQFEQVRPIGYQRVKKTPDGDELDLEAIVAARTDIKNATSPDERVYSRRERLRRDVGAALLIDLSASTDDILSDAVAEPVTTPARAQDIRDPFFDEDEECDFAARMAEEAKKRRIIDILRESALLLGTALESLGDRYAVYGFSGYGRDCVEFFVAKEFDDPLDDRVLDAMAEMKPKRSTRMGPAVRHATAKLEACGAALKVLMIVSDGFPQDHDYGPDRGEHEYGVQDTARALTEAEAGGIETFCVTVDRSGHDYLRRMCPEDRYLVIEETAELPEALRKAYRQLTRT